MEKIEDVRFTECVDSKYVHPARMHYKQDGKDKIWDLMRVHDSVAAVLYNKTRDVLIYVRQFRPAVFFGAIAREDTTRGHAIDMKKYPVSLGMTRELCAGIMDKPGAPSIQVIQEEILEECGYKVPLSSIEKITGYRSSVGISGSKQELFYAEVTDDMKQTSGGGNVMENEMVEVVEISIPEAWKMITDESVMRPPACLFGTLWFLTCKYKDAKPGTA
ncbi:uridine diphosphate glucose pyrophosphatase NUDT14-like isoform X1 [Ornithodoros turicata]|uniref:uridine diphosphate glucose pyrophosphatase NUDT14-like isoform X1 n=2 Tax=Ornithodoros turicata TaxID=34597 RepID=UPI003138F004